LLDMLTRAHAGQCMEVAFTQRQSAFHTGAAVQAQAPFSKSTEAPGAPGSPGDGVTDVTDVTDGVVAFDSGDEAVAAACVTNRTCFISLSCAASRALLDELSTLHSMD